MKKKSVLVSLAGKCLLPLFVTLVMATTWFEVPKAFGYMPLGCGTAICDAD